MLMSDKKCLEKVLLVSDFETYVDFSVLEMFSTSMSGKATVLVDSIEEMCNRLNNWRSSIEYEIVNADKSVRENVEKILGFNITSWENINPNKLYEAILKAKNCTSVNGNYIVAFKEEPKSAILAAIRAAFDERSFCLISSYSDSSESFNSILGNFKDINSIYIFTEELNQVKVNWVHNQVQSLPYKSTKEIYIPSIPYGFHTASSHAIMTFLNLKQRFSEEDSSASDIAILPLSDIPINTNNADYIIMNRDTATSENIHNKDFRIFSLSAHGRSDLAFIGQDYLCGKSDCISAEKCEGKKFVPMCMKAPFKCLRTEGNKVEVNRLLCDHILVNSCGSLGLTDSEFGQYFNLSYSSLEGKAISYVGTTRWKDGDMHESILYLNALNTGYSLGEATVLLNKALQFNFYENDDNVFVLFGDPAYRVSMRSENCMKTIICEEETHIKSTLTKDFQHYFFTDKEILKACYEGNLNIIINGISEEYCVKVPAQSDKGEGVLVFIMAPYNQKLPCEFEVSLSMGIAEFNQFVEAYREVNFNLNPILRIHKFYPNLKGTLNEIDNKAVNILYKYKDTYLRPHTIPRLITDINKFYKIIEKVDEDTCKYLNTVLNTTNFRFAEHYSKKFMLRKNGSKSKVCYICGSPITVRTQVNEVIPDCYRDEHVCINCGGIEDKPDSDFDIEIFGGSVDEATGIRKTTLTVINNTSREQKGFGCIAVRNSARWSLKIEPEYYQYTIKPYSRTSYTFDICIGDTPPHKHTLQAAFVKNQKVYLGMRPFWVTE